MAGKGLYAVIAISTAVALCGLQTLFSGLENKVFSKPTPTPQREVMVGSVRYTGPVAGTGRTFLQSITGQYNISPEGFCTSLSGLNPGSEDLRYWSNTEDEIVDCGLTHNGEIDIYVPVFK
jgi:hypothetical protein